MNVPETKEARKVRKEEIALALQSDAQETENEKVNVELQKESEEVQKVEPEKEPMEDLCDYVEERVAIWRVKRNQEKLDQIDGPENPIFKRVKKGLEHNINKVALVKDEGVDLSNEKVKHGQACFAIFGPRKNVYVGMYGGKQKCKLEQWLDTDKKFGVNLSSENQGWLCIVAYEVKIKNIGKGFITVDGYSYLNAEVDDKMDSNGA